MRTGIRCTLAALAGLALASGTAWAGHHEGGEEKGHSGHHGKRFEKRDTDGNGEISKAEWLAASEAHFEKADADGNGSVTRDEMKAAHRKMREHRRAKDDAADETVDE